MLFISMGVMRREPREERRRWWRGVGPAGRPSLFSFGGSVILKI